jgi:nucleoside-diphosphate-sugar epimerase
MNQINQINQRNQINQTNKTVCNVLVTGGAGFIGSNLTEALLKKGHRVRVLDNFSTGKKENLLFAERFSSFEMVEGDIRDRAVCQTAMRNVEYVFHQAALPSVQRSVEDPLTTHMVNAVGTLNVLLATKEAGVRKVIYASSSSIYGDTPTLPKVETMPSNPLSPYALQKQVGEKYCRLFSQLYGLETVSLRYFNVFGPKQDPASIYSAVIPRFINALLRRKSPTIFGDGEQSRDFTYIDNVVHANLLAMSAEDCQGEAMNIACGSRASLNQLWEILAGIVGSEVAPVYSEARKGDVKHSLADISKAKQLLNYDPLVGIETGLARTVEYFKNRPNDTSTI